MQHRGAAWLGAGQARGQPQLGASRSASESTGLTPLRRTVPSSAVTENSMAVSSGVSTFGPEAAPAGDGTRNHTRGELAVRTAVDGDDRGRGPESQRMADILGVRGSRDSDVSPQDKLIQTLPRRTRPGRCRKSNLLTVDFYSGAGGLVDAGGFVIARLHQQKSCRRTYVANNGNECGTDRTRNSSRSICRLSVPSDGPPWLGIIA